MSTDSIARQPVGTPAGGQFAASSHSETGTTLAPVSTATWWAAAKDLSEAWEVRQRLQSVIAKATAHLIAVDIRKVTTDAAYLLLDEEQTEYGPRVSACAVLDANENAIGDNIEELVENFPDGEGAAELHDGMEELLGNYDDLRHTGLCDAVSDENGRPDGKITRYRKYRIDLVAAAALYPEGGLA